MPTFPTYHGELPQCLNPLNPRHYWLLLYWVFFRPTALKCYLYQADPDLYRSSIGINILRIYKIPAYYKLFVILPNMSIFFAIFLGLPCVFLGSWLLNLPIDFLEWTLGSIAGIVFSLLVGILVGVISCSIHCLGIGVGMSVVVGVAGCIVNCMGFGVVAGLTGNLISQLNEFLGKIFTTFYGNSTGTIIIFASITLGLLFAILFAILFAKILSIVLKRTFSSTAYLIMSIMIGMILLAGTGFVMMAMSMNVILTPGGRIIQSLGILIYFAVFNAVIGILGNLIGDFITGIAGASVCVMSGMLLVMMPIYNGTELIIIMTVTAIMCSLGAFRLIFYPFQFVLALGSRFRSIRHPLEWDELTVFPLPRTKKFLAQQFKQDEQQGLHLLADIGRNSFRLPLVQAVLYRYLHAHSAPLRFLYSFLAQEEYAIAPIQPMDWEHNLTIKQLLLGLSAVKFVKIIWNRRVIFFDRLIWWISYPLRERHHTPLTDFAGMLSELLAEEMNEGENFDFSKYAKVYKNLSAYPDGREIDHTFDAMVTFLSYQTLTNLPAATSISTNLRFDNPIRPIVITALQHLGDIGKEIQTYQDSTSRANRMAALARATDALKKLDEYVQAEMMTPEQYLLRRIIRQWQDVLISAGGKLGRAEEIGPVVNPYIAGNPVSGELFVGREDILRRLEELWSGEGQKPSVVLYGHRRMGKSSILHNLGTRFGQNTEIIDFNMQRTGLVSSTGELLHNLALTIYDALEAHFQRLLDSGNFDLTEPEEERFLEHNPYTAFDRFLKQVDRIRGEKRFIITIDEFEMIEQKIQRGNLEPLLLDFWRGVIQTYPWIIMAFAGLHTLQEMTQDYWNPLFGSVTGIPVSFLKENAAKRLITQPSADFALDYDQDAISEIVRLTYGQPYLVQLICHCLVSHFNRQTFEEGLERERRFHRSDVEAVITAPEFFRDGDAYFNGVWQQAQHDDTPEEHEILKTLAQAEAGLLIEHLVNQSGLALEKVQQTLKFLQRHDMVTETASNWKFTVELMRRWVLHSK